MKRPQGRPPRRASITLAVPALVLAVVLSSGAAFAAPATGSIGPNSHATAAAGDSARVVFHKEPYLIFPGVPDEMQVLWQLYAAAPCTLEWGGDTSYSLGSAVTAEYGSGHQHTYTIADLAPDELYYYRVRSGGESRAGAFRSAPPADATRLKFLAYGDTRSYPSDHDAVAAEMIAAYTNDPEYQTFTLFAGDFVSNGDSESDWDTQFFSPAYSHIAEMHANLPTEACRGNHEGTAVLMGKYFPYPYVPGLGYAWSFDYGPAHFVVVDQYVAYSTGSAQLNWVENDLASSDKTWNFLLFHEPGWSAGGHANNTSVQNYLQPLCVEYGVPFAFAGHNHYYARAVVDGVQHVTTGGGGAPLYTPSPTYPNIVVAVETHHFCEISIDGNELRYTVVEPDGTVIDTLIIAPTSVPGDGEAEPRGPTLDQPAPNPTDGPTKLSFTLPSRSSVVLSVYDVGGRLVRTLLQGDVDAGEHSVMWDGLDDQGGETAAGVYFARLTDDGAIVARKVVRVR
jgi:hypothetical protein